MPQNSENRVLPKSDRSAQTVQTIIEAAIAAIETAPDVSDVSSEYLSKKSGFSVGALYRYFKNKEDLYARIWLFFIGRMHQALVHKLEGFPYGGTLKQLMMMITEHYFDNLIGRRPQRVIPLYRLYIRSCQDPENIAKPIDVLIEPLMTVMHNNTSGTMRTLNVDEIRIYLRAALAMVRSDFLEQNPYFGTRAHQAVVLDSLVKLFGK